MTEVTEGLEGVLVWGQTQEEHDARLHATMQNMEKAGLTLNMDKCDLSKKELKLLDHIISGKGVQPDPTKTNDVKEMVEPSNISKLWNFLGMVKQLGKFIP